MADYSAQISRIRQAQSLDEIRDVARQFSAQAMGDGGVLYSRPVGGVTSEVIALELAKKGGLPVINETPRAIFLSDLQVKQAVDSSAARILKAQGVSPAALEALTLDFQYGNPKAVANSLTSLEGCLWGDASREFAASMRGDIKVVATAANMERVFGKVELPTILDNPNVQTLGGKSLADLRAIAAAEGTQALLDPVQAQFVEAAPRGIFKSAGALSITTEPVALSREFADAMGIDRLQQIFSGSRAIDVRHRGACRYRYGGPSGTGRSQDHARIDGAGACSNAAFTARRSSGFGGSSRPDSSRRHCPPSGWQSRY